MRTSSDRVLQRSAAIAHDQMHTGIQHGFPIKQISNGYHMATHGHGAQLLKKRISEKSVSVEHGHKAVSPITMKRHFTPVGMDKV